jgi:hypothetical protein
METFYRLWRGVDRSFASIRILRFMMTSLAGGSFLLAAAAAQQKRSAVETADL